MSAGDMEQRTGRLITLEGGEGVGKTTNVGLDRKSTRLNSSHNQT